MAQLEDWLSSLLSQIHVLNSQGAFSTIEILVRQDKDSTVRSTPFSPKAIEFSKLLFSSTTSTQMQCFDYKRLRKFELAHNPKKFNLGENLVDTGENYSTERLSN